MNRFALYLMAVLIFAVLALFGVIIFNAIVYEIIGFENMFSNLSLIPASYLICFLWLISAFTVVLMLLLRVKRKECALILIGLLVFTLFCVAGEEQFHRYQVNRFFGEHNINKIVILTENPDKARILSPSNCEILEYPIDRFQQKLDRSFAGAPNPSPDKRYFVKFDPESSKFLIVDRKRNVPILKVKHLALTSADFKWSSDSRFIAYDYAYDKDDLSKVFVVKVETGETILLAAGISPLWISE
ncbi:MAG: hypothetical protein AABZ57_04155 [Candidatus Margulisiibacteriota bacterium]